MKLFLGSKIIFTSIVLAVFFVGCGQPPQPPMPNELALPTPILDNTGEFMFPYTQDGVLAEWTDKAIEAEGASNVGGAVGAYAGAKALEQVPFIGGFLGQAAGEEIGRQIVLQSAGGMDFIIESSDISFNNVEDYCVYAYAKYSMSEHYAGAMKAAYALYGDLTPTICWQTLYKAKKKI